MAERRGRQSTRKLRTADQVPVFRTEDEEHRFWQRHELSDALLDRMEPIGEDVLPPPRSRSVSVRFDEDVIARLKALAARRGKRYQTLLKEFVGERLYEEERREGILPTRPDRET